MKRLKQFFALCVLSASFLTVSAQTQDNQVSQESQVIADVNIVDVVVNKEINGVISGKYALLGKLGQQNDINVGIVAVATKGNTVVAVKNLSQRVSLREKELAKYDFTYTIPSTLQGEVIFYLQAYTGGGVPLSALPLFKKVFPVDTPRNLNCKISEGSAHLIECQLTKAGDITFSASKNTLLNTPMIVETKHVATDNGKITFGLTLTPGKYYVDANVSGTDEHVYVPIKIDGVYGTIMNALVSKKSNGVLSIMVATNLPTFDPFNVRTMLTDSEGKNCGMANHPIGARVPAVLMEVNTSCEKGTSKTELLDATGKVLDSKTEPFSVIPFGKEPTVTNQIPDVPVQHTSPKATQVGVIILVIGAVVVFLYGYKKRAKGNISQA